MTDLNKRRLARILFAVLAAVLCLSLCLGGASAERWYAGLTVEEIVSRLTLEQKASQMVQPACYNINDGEMRQLCYGSILSQGANLNAGEWRDYTAWFQKAALASDAGIPYIYGQDDVHGVNYCLGAVYFPHNIGLGAANDEDLMYRIGKITADEAKLCHMLWNFAPESPSPGTRAGAGPMKATARTLRKSKSSASLIPGACWKKAWSSARSIFSGTATLFSALGKAWISPGSSTGGTPAFPKRRSPNCCPYTRRRSTPARRRL